MEVNSSKRSREDNATKSPKAKNSKSLEFNVTENLLAETNE